MRKIFSRLAAISSLLLPSFEIMARGVQIVPQLTESSKSRARIFLIYCFTSFDSLKIPTISETEKYHISSCHTRRTSCFSKIVGYDVFSTFFGIIIEIFLFYYTLKQEKSLRLQVDLIYFHQTMYSYLGMLVHCKAHKVMNELVV